MAISGVDISVYSFISAMVFYSFSIMGISILTKRTAFIAVYGIRFILIAIVLSVLRLLIPLDIYWAKIIDFNYILQLFENIALFFNMDLKYVKFIFLAIWACGSLCLLLYISYGVITDIYTLKRLKKIENDKVLKIIKENEFAKMDIVISPYINVPQVWGIVKPHVYLPDLELDESEWRVIIRHEIQHIYNYDMLIKIIILSITIIFWWNPIMLLLWKKTDHFLEIRCDERVLKNVTQEEKTAYLNMIVKVLRQTNESHSRIATSALIHTSAYQLTKQRFEVILTGNKQKRRKNCIAYFILCMVFIASYFVVLQPRSTPKEDHAYESSVSDFILCTKNDEYLFFKEGKFYKELSKEEMEDAEYRNVEIILEE